MAADSSNCFFSCCSGALPDDHALYYGFSRFAIELNEILDSEKDFLPNTDTRFRPDQRFLEVSAIANKSLPFVTLTHKSKTSITMELG
jgi:hypothetical protein